MRRSNFCLKGMALVYRCKLNVLLVGLELRVAEAIRGVAPKEWFTHSILALDAFGPYAGKKPDVVIFKGYPGMQLGQIKTWVGGDARLIMCMDQASSLTAGEMELMEDVWPGNLRPKVAAVLFEKLLQKLKLEKDAWLWNMELDNVIDTSMDLIWFKGRYGEHWRVNDAFCKIVGKTKEDIRGKQHYYIWGLTPESYREGQYVCLETEQDVREAGKTCSYREHVKGPEGIVELLTLKTPLYDKGEFIGTVGVAKDITKELEYYNKMMLQANTDELTGLMNRRYFYSIMKEIMSEHSMSLLYLDLDFFKALNDRYGHQVGDDALKCFAGLLKKNFDDGIITRLGGDEFAVALRGNFTRQEFTELLTSFMTDVRERFYSSEFFSGLSVSIGAVENAPAGISVDTLVHQGDMAMYEAKNHGKNKFCFFDSHNNTL